MTMDNVSSKIAAAMVFSKRRALLLGALTFFLVSACGADGDDAETEGTADAEFRADEIAEMEASERKNSDEGENIAQGSAAMGGAENVKAPVLSGDYVDIVSFGTHHGTSSHTHSDSLEGGRTPITTEALDSYNALRSFQSLENASLEEIGRWAFDHNLTNNATPGNGDLRGTGLYFAMQGAKVGWIDKNKLDASAYQSDPRTSDPKYNTNEHSFDPRSFYIADIQAAARAGDTDSVMETVDQIGLDGYAEYLEHYGLVDIFVNTLKMEPHYGGYMHGRAHGSRAIGNNATAHDVHHLTVVSHDQRYPLMNDTFDWPQWPAMAVPTDVLVDYFQTMVTLDTPPGS